MLYCPTCRSNIDSAPNLAGQLVACPFCAQQFYMPPLAVVAMAEQPQPSIVTSRPRHYARTRDRQAIGMVAAIISLFIPGLGQLCQGRVGAGVTFLVGWFVLGAAGFLFIGPLVLPLLFFFALWAVVDAAWG